MNIYEVWDKLDKLNESEADLIDKILWSTPDYEFYYDGFARDYTTDHFDPESSHGHYQTSQKYYWNGFTYEVDAVEIFEQLTGHIIEENLAKVQNTEISNKLRALFDATKNAPTEEQENTLNTFELFVAENLDDIVDLFDKPLKEHYREEAEEWAEEQLDPESPSRRYY